MRDDEKFCSCVSCVHEKLDEYHNNKHKGTESLLAYTKKLFNRQSDQLYDHFSKISTKYSDIRTLDVEPISFIQDRIQHITRVKAADIGCGDGRYSVLLSHLLPRNSILKCIDANDDMLEQMSCHVNLENMPNLEIKKGNAEELPFENNSLNTLMTFNAIHHFDLSSFIQEASRVLEDDSHLFIYTRLKEQNSRNIWGKYFPLFDKKETRLYDLENLTEELSKHSALKIDEIQFFKYSRTSSMNELLTRAKNNHYSTFALYSSEEFSKSLEKFQNNLVRHYKNLDKINWVDENIMITLRKEKERQN